MAPPLLFPTWLLFILTAVVMFPLFCMAANPPVVADVELFLNIFPFAERLLTFALFNIPANAELEAIPVIAQLIIVLLLIFKVRLLVWDVNTFSIQLKVPEVCPLVMVIVLLLITVVNATAGEPLLSCIMPLNATAGDTEALTSVL